MKNEKLITLLFIFFIAVSSAFSDGKSKQYVRGEVYEWFTANPTQRTEIFINEDQPGNRRLMQLPGATIRLIHAKDYTNIDTNSEDYYSATAETDSLGYFEFKPQTLPVGWVMLLSVSKPGFIGWSKKFTVSADTTKRDVYCHIISKTFHKMK